MKRGGHKAPTLSSRHRDAFRRVGVSNLLDAAPCDRLGVPVGLALRPRGRVARVFDGKGMTTDVAMIAAGMEAVETAAAEQPVLAIRATSAAALGRARLLRPEQLPAFAQVALDPGRATLWCAGQGLFTRAKIWAPLELVGMGCRVPAARRLGLSRNSNGLAAGATLSEAILAALLEVIERDQLARWLDDAPSIAARERFVCARHDPPLDDLLRRCRVSGLLPILWRIDDDLGVPAALCQLFDLGRDRRRPWALTSGSAAHPQVLVAARQAILEAIQVRVALRLRHPADRPVPRLHAARIDLIRREMEIAVKAPPASPVRDFAGIAGKTPKAIVDMVVRRIMRRRGVEPVVFRLSKRDSFPAVVRVIVPGFRDAYP